MLFKIADRFVRYDISAKFEKSVSLWVELNYFYPYFFRFFCIECNHSMHFQFFIIYLADALVAYVEILLAGNTYVETCYLANKQEAASK